MFTALSPVFVPLRFDPVTDPTDPTLEGVIAPSVSVIAGVVLEVATLADTPLAVTTETLVTVPAEPAPYGPIVAPLIRA